MANRAYIGLGSNLGDRLANMQRAIDMLMPAAFPTRLSGVYESEPWSFHSEFLFLNAVAEVETDVEPRELLTELHKIEYTLGRSEAGQAAGRQLVGTRGGDIEEAPEYHDRVIDLDILWYQDFEFKSGSFTVPHEWATIRAFVLKPWAELDETVRLRGVQLKHCLEALPPDELDKTWARPDLRLALPALSDLLGGLKVPKL